MFYSSNCGKDWYWYFNSTRAKTGDEWHKVLLRTLNKEILVWFTQWLYDVLWPSTVFCRQSGPHWSLHLTDQMWAKKMYHIISRYLTCKSFSSKLYYHWSAPWVSQKLWQCLPSELTTVCCFNNQSRYCSSLTEYEICNLAETFIKLTEVLFLYIWHILDLYMCIWI